MKKLPRVALVAAGKVTALPLVHTRAFSDRLGPVKAPSLRVASRIANTLRAGHPVADYEQFEDVALVLLCLPDEIAAAEIDAMKSQRQCWTGITVVLCSNELGVGTLAPIAASGATTGSLSVVPGYDAHWLVLEGDRTVKRLIRPLLPGRSRLTLIQRSYKAEFLAAVNALGPDLMPLLKSASETLMKAGVNRVEAAAMLERQASRTIQAYLKFGKKPGAD